MSDIYNEILDNSNIQTILEYYGLKIHKNKCQCPFHNDTHPSMNIQQNKGIAKCFSCGTGGNAISFIQKYESEINHNPITIKDAMQKAIDIQHLNITIPNTSNQQLTEEQQHKQDLINIFRDAIAICENNLKINNIDSQKALEYLKSRKLTDEIIKEFHIGFDSSKNMMFDRLFEKYNVNDLVNLGIAKEYNNWISDVFKERITIPIFDENGNPVGFGARTINHSVKPKYLNSKANELFDKSKLLFNFHKAKFFAKNDEIIIVEGYMDVISSKQLKIDNVVGTMGTALTNEHIGKIKKLNCEATLCLDNDEAGRNAMIRIIPELQKAGLKVNVLDISRLGKYKDFGDLLMANLTKEQIYQTKISAFTFLLQYQYVKGKELNAENIHNLYNKMWKDGLIQNTKDKFSFKEYVMKNSNYTNDEIEDMIHPQNINNKKINTYKDVCFYNFVMNLIQDYAKTHNDNVLLKYAELGRLNSITMEESLNNGEFLSQNGLTINIGKYINDYIFQTEDYQKFKNDKSFILENLLKNAKSFDSKGNIINIELTFDQKEIILKQYKESFDKEIQEYIENNPDEFEEIFIANSNSQFEKLFPKTYVSNIKEQAINRFKNDGVMEAVRYALAYSDDMIPVMSREFVNHDKFKTLLVVNNNKNILGLTAENIKQISTKDEKEKKNTKEELQQSTKDKIAIPLLGNEKESYRGIYIPVNESNQVFIPKELYRKDKNELQILSNRSNMAIMSEYKIDEAQKTRKWMSQLSLEDFSKKYLNLLSKVHNEKEVMA